MSTRTVLLRSAKNSPRTLHPTYSPCTSQNQDTIRNSSPQEASNSSTRSLDNAAPFKAPPLFHQDKPPFTPFPFLNVAMRPPRRVTQVLQKVGRMIS